MIKLWFTAGELVERWGVNKPTLLAIIKEAKLKSFHPSLEYYYEPDRLIEMATNKLSEIMEPTWPGLSKICFFHEHVYEAEKEWEIPIDESADELNAKERRELGQLHREKTEWDLSIKATALSVEFAFNHEKRIIYDDFYDFLDKNGFKDLYETTKRKIWKAILQKYRHKTGRPRKK